MAGDLLAEAAALVGNDTRAVRSAVKYGVPRIVTHRVHETPDAHCSRSFFQTPAGFFPLGARDDDVLPLHRVVHLVKEILSLLHVGHTARSHDAKAVHARGIFPRTNVPRHARFLRPYHT